MAEQVGDVGEPLSALRAFVMLFRHVTGHVTRESFGRDVERFEAVLAAFGGFAAVQVILVVDRSGRRGFRRDKAFRRGQTF